MSLQVEEVVYLSITVFADSTKQYTFMMLWEVQIYSGTPKKFKLEFILKEWQEHN